MIPYRDVCLSLYSSIDDYSRSLPKYIKSHPCKFAGATVFIIITNESSFYAITKVLTVEVHIKSCA